VNDCLYDGCVRECVHESLFNYNFKIFSFFFFTKVPGLSYETLKLQIEELVRWVRVKVPGVMVVTMNVVLKLYRVCPHPGGCTKCIL
jgi:hypothetical protein